MGVPLTTLTHKPIQYSIPLFGGDDTQLGRGGLFGTIVEWDLSAKDDCFKAYAVFFIKKSFAFLHVIGIGKCFFEKFGGLEGRLRECEVYQTGLNRNRQAREKIVAAIGGEIACRAIRAISLNEGEFTERSTCLRLSDGYFNRGESMLQGEDPAGRKFALMRLTDPTGRIRIATIHQRYRETWINPDWPYRYKPGWDNGSLWAVNLLPPIAPSITSYADGDTDRAAEFIQKIREGRHERFTLAPKP